MKENTVDTKCVYIIVETARATDTYINITLYISGKEIKIKF